MRNSTLFLLVHDEVRLRESLIETELQIVVKATIKSLDVIEEEVVDKV
jgi:hypothetical protein